MQTTKKYFTHYILERARLEDETQDKTQDETQDETRDPKSAGSVLRRRKRGDSLNATVYFLFLIEGG